MTLGERVKKLRLDLRLSQQQLAERMGYSSGSSINKIETGRPVTQKIIVRLADALHTTPAYLMGWEDKPPVTIEINQRWVDEVGSVEFTDEELTELINFANFLLSKRGRS